MARRGTSSRRLTISEQPRDEIGHLALLIDVQPGQRGDDPVVQLRVVTLIQEQRRDWDEEMAADLLQGLQPGFGAGEPVGQGLRGCPQ